MQKDQPTVTQKTSGIMFDNTASDCYGTWQETFDFYYGKARRGDVVEVGNTVAVGYIGDVKVSGSDSKQKCFRLVSSSFETSSTFKWNGKVWKEQ